MLFFYTILLFTSIINGNEEDQAGLVHVRAVFVRCNLKRNGEDSTYDQLEPISSFEKEELYRNNKVKHCKRKIIITLRLNDNQNDLTEEYIPIDHVYDPITEGNVRLLNPYVIRIKQDPLLQAYELSLVNTVNGEVKNPSDDGLYTIRTKRFLKGNKTINPDSKMNSYVVKIGDCKVKNHCMGGIQDTGLKLSYETTTVNEPMECECSKRKVHKHHKSTTSIHHIHRTTAHNHKSHHDTTEPENMVTSEDEKLSDETASFDDDVRVEIVPEHRRTANVVESKRVKRRVNRRNKTNIKESGSSVSPISDSDIESQEIKENIIISNGSGPSLSDIWYNVYSISHPTLWHSITVQVYEKQTYPDSSTEWVDITHGNELSVGTHKRESTDATKPNCSVSYMPIDYLKPENHLINSPDNLFLLIPSPPRDKQQAYREELAGGPGEFMVVPTWSVSGLNNIFSKKRSHVWYARDTPYKMFNKLNFKNQPLEMWRNEKMSNNVEDSKSCFLRSWCGNSATVQQMKGHRFLTVAHTKPHRSQITIEAKADNNELVRIGASSRLSTITTDSSYPAKTTLIVHATNTGLVSAYFRAVISECPTSWSELMKDSYISTPVLIPPRHTRQIHMNIAGELPHGAASCSVGLVNDDDHLTSIRKVRIKKGDRCFCVWHCSCACLSISPQLNCESLPLEQLNAAGFVPGDMPIDPNKYCCNTENVDAILLFSSLMVVLLFLGLIKAMLSICFPIIGMLGLDRLILIPRPIDAYFEKHLQDETVIYDCAGWPVHPVTKKRTVRVIDAKSEFFLNLVFFIIFPSVVTWSLIKFVIGHLCPRWRDKLGKNNHPYVWSEPQNINMLKTVSEKKNTNKTKSRSKKEKKHRKKGKQNVTDPSESSADQCFCETSVTDESDDTKYIVQEMQKSKANSVMSKETTVR